ncbi:F-box/LRR-repeat protein 21-like [Physella acuta]|uniref:F-box/LRR-repeat protein 21-like n=1 Tax=Physella acuta TaxID=109671 RepID=UPI0027DB5B4C|nr:F-box/LRR-repeat protein 21-like [Physella acuta]
MSLFSIKKIKRAAAEFVGGGTKQPDWSQLPYEILLNVFRYLSNSDKYHAALTCKSWLRPLSEPSVWQSGDFVFDSESDEKAITFVKITGKSLRHIHAECKVVEPETWDDDGSATCTGMYQFLANLLNSRNQQLLTFKLTNLCILEIDGDRANSRSFSEVVELLTKVLEVQQQLRVLDLSNSNKSRKNCREDHPTVDQGMRLLHAASKNCANTLQKLTIARFVSLIDIYPNDLSFLPQFRSAIAGFSKLSDLDLSYGYLEDDLLLSLARTTTSLKVITVRVDKPPYFETSTTPAAWENLTAVCPELRVIFFIKTKYMRCMNTSFQDTTTMLTPSMPLYQVKWKADSVIAIEKIKNFFQHVEQNFQETLHHLDLQTDVRLDMECIDAMFKCLQPCKNLNSLSLCLTCDKSDDEEIYTIAIRDAMWRCSVSCDVTLNGQAVK